MGFPSRFRRLAWAAWLLLIPVLAPILGSSCGNEDALVLSVRTQMGTIVQMYSVEIQDRDTRKVIYSSGPLQVNPPRDLFASPLRVGLRFDKKGPYLVHILGSTSTNLDQLPIPGSAEPYLFYAGVVHISGTSTGDALLLPVAPEYDQDRDHFPDLMRWPASLPEAQDQYGSHPELLDCVDAAIAPGDITPANLHNYDIHPLALSRCNVRWRPSLAGAQQGQVNEAPFGLLDTTCGGQPATCLDEDGDGESSQTDCDDKDPHRYHGNARPRNCCQCGDPKSCRMNHNKLLDPTTCQNPQRCGTSYDWDCTGQSVACFRDDDCDGFSPDDPIPDQRDCDDTNPNIYPGAPKNCQDSSKDWSCDGHPECVPCDIDGDGFQRIDAINGCPKDANKQVILNPEPSTVDCNDADRGVFPGSSDPNGMSQGTLVRKDLNNQEGSSVAGALRGLCRNRNPDKSAQDADCDGVAWKGCPPAVGSVSGKPCDQDGDGFPVNTDPDCNPKGLLLDCDDTDPTTFPGAPELCQSAKNPNPKDSNCDKRSVTCVSDKDGDGYQGVDDCNDTDPNIHPFATEFCNGIDDDCDGLVDEGNPDLNGQPLVQSTPGGGQSILSCKDIGPGQCAQQDNSSLYSGHCVCSGMVPITTPDPKLGCPGASSGNAFAPRCFGAYQPLTQELCNGLDDNCDGSIPLDEQDVDGDGFIACARDTTVPLKPGLKGRGDCNDKNPSIFPGAPEICDGFLNNSDGTKGTCTAALPGDEADTDKDGYMTCVTCSTVTTGLSTAAKGCGDCDDGNLNIYPGAPEICDGFLDNSDKVKGTCNALAPALEQDLDQDGFLACTQCDTSKNWNRLFTGCGDCDDLNKGSYPGATELCDGFLNNADKNLGTCNNMPPMNELDPDGDKYMSCTACAGKVLKSGLTGCGDCDDSRPYIFPGAPEICDGFLDNSDGNLGTCSTPAPVNERDVDGDKYLSCTVCAAAQLKNGLTGCGDCDDNNPATFPGAPEICDGFLNNSDGNKGTCLNTVQTSEADGDKDGFIACSTCAAGTQLRPGVVGCKDCDDTNPRVFPGAPELCDGNDNSCSGTLGANESDLDKDSYIACIGCDPTKLRSGLAGCGDCDDHNFNTHPNALEICDGFDNTCSGILPGSETDLDNDKYLTCTGCLTANLKAGLIGCGDCDDTNLNIHPNALEICDGQLDNSDGNIGQCGLPPPANEQDLDGDKWLACSGCTMATIKAGLLGCGDCNDNNPAVYPGAPEICDGFNNSCGVTLPVNEQDLDGDKYLSCTGCVAANLHAGLLGCNDCDDNNKNTYPGAPEICDGFNNSCSGTLPLNEQDTDGDKWLSCSPCSAGNLKTGLKGCGDCDDSNANTFPGASELCDGYNNSCSGTLPANEQDIDGDKWISCTGCMAGQIKPTLSGCNDCDDFNANTFPGATEICDGYLNNCNGTLPQNEKDPDGDGFLACSGCITSNLKTGIVGCNDCDDGNRNTYPGATEICDGNLNNCGGTLPQSEKDADGDGWLGCSPCIFGNLKTGLKGCGDCDDSSSRTYPGATELCDGYNNSCSGTLPANEQDVDRDNYMGCTGCVAGQTKPGLAGCGDCNDSNGNIYPGATEICDGYIDNCGGTLPTNEADGDGDTYMACTGCIQANLKPGVTGCADCDDTNRNIYPGAPEICDGYADNCGTTVPVNEQDTDGDHYLACNGCVAMNLKTGVLGCSDCNDNNATIHPGAPELCDGLNNKCSVTYNETTNDGTDDCKVTPAVKCCPLIPQCIDITTDAQNCGSCGNVCNTNTADRCTASVCKCANDPACGAGTVCIPGQGCAGCRNTPDCGTGQTCCSQTCKALQTDITNCGTCGKVCTVPQNGMATCTSGNCGVQCNTGYSVCNTNTCKDLQNDVNNCGSCGHVCATGNTCCNGLCKDLTIDVSNCGMCGNACPVPNGGNATCVASFCGITCNGTLTACSGSCVNTLTDTANCGMCGHACGAGQTCCSGACQTLSSDPSNCGTCGHVCTAPNNGVATCSASVCGIKCNMQFTACGLSCFNESTDVSNCGGCGTVCSSNNIATPTCVASICSGTCNAGFGDCNNNKQNDGCETQISGTDVSNCGGCNTVCSTANISRTCVGGVCSGTCSTGFADCNGNKQTDGCETRINGTDVSNCGGCNTVCSTTNISRTCVGGVCSGNCNTGFADCDNDKLTNGCETTTTTDPSNCGGCGKVCSSGHITTPTCTASVCSGNCDTGFADCDNNKLANGCETTTTTGAGNCGGCGKVCSNVHIATPTCTASVCSGNCNTGFADCDNDKLTNGCETTTTTDASNCGGCNMACSSNHIATPTCAASVCNGSCDTGYANCDNDKLSNGCETPISADPNHCGGCALVCSGNHIDTPTCAAGLCSGNCNTGFADCDNNKLNNGCETTTTTDASNCGGCGKVCSGNHIATPACAASVCSGNCDTGFADCDNDKLTNGCETNTTTSAANCGGCNMACSSSHIATPTCAASVCSGNCDTGFADCDNDKLTNGCETPISTDPNHCGGCALVCSGGHIDTPTCVSGICSGTCNTGFADCDNSKLTNGCETATTTDPMNCGGCSMVCSSAHIATPTCTAGACSGNCNTGFADCDNDKRTNGCETDTNTSAANCGGCNMACSSSHIATPTCTAGACSGNCNTGFADCDSDKLTNGCETPVSADPNRCGGCALVCSGNHIDTPTCAAGICSGTCNAGYADCNGSKLADGCETQINGTDVMNCGGCGVVCNMGESCCNGVCKDLQADPNNCNTCGTVCTQPAHSTAVCSAGVCGFNCGTGYSQCGAACVDLQTDHDFCGDCNTACMATQTCCAGGCTSTVTDSGNCGTCGHQCTPPVNGTSSCVASACVPVCNGTYVLCSGLCVDLTSDVNNCNACGTKCTAPVNGSTNCVAGVCTPACNTGFSLCGAVCVDELTDSNNCGACAHACIAAQADGCTAGVCTCNMMTACDGVTQTCQGAMGCQ